MPKVVVPEYSALKCDNAESTKFVKLKESCISNENKNDSSELCLPILKVKLCDIFTCSRSNCNEFHLTLESFNEVKKKNLTVKLSDVFSHFELKCDSADSNKSVKPREKCKSTKNKKSSPGMCLPTVKVQLCDIPIRLKKKFNASLENYNEMEIHLSNSSKIKTSSQFSEPKQDVLHCDGKISLSNGVTKYIIGEQNNVKNNSSIKNSSLSSEQKKNQESSDLIVFRTKSDCIPEKEEMLEYSFLNVVDTEQPNPAHLDETEVKLYDALKSSNEKLDLSSFSENKKTEYYNEVRKSGRNISDFEFKCGRDDSNQFVKSKETCKSNKNEKDRSELCLPTLKVQLCDIFTCCKSKCNEFQLTLEHCKEVKKKNLSVKLSDVFSLSELKCDSANSNKFAEQRGKCKLNKNKKNSPEICLPSVKVKLCDILTCSKRKCKELHENINLGELEVKLSDALKSSNEKQDLSNFSKNKKTEYYSEAMKIGEDIAYSAKKSCCSKDNSNEESSSASEDNSEEEISSKSKQNKHKRKKRFLKIKRKETEPESESSCETDTEPESESSGEIYTNPPSESSSEDYTEQESESSIETDAESESESSSETYKDPYWEGNHNIKECAAKCDACGYFYHINFIKSVMLKPSELDHLKSLVEKGALNPPENDRLKSLEEKQVTNSPENESLKYLEGEKANNSPENDPLESTTGKEAANSPENDLLKSLEGKEATNSPENDPLKSLEELGATNQRKESFSEIKRKRKLFEISVLKATEGSDYKSTEKEADKIFTDDPKKQKLISDIVDEDGSEERIAEEVEGDFLIGNEAENNLQDDESVEEERQQGNERDREVSNYIKFVQKNREEKMAFLKSLCIDEIKEDINAAAKAKKEAKTRHYKNWSVPEKSDWSVPERRSKRISRLESVNLCENFIFKRAYSEALEEVSESDESEEIKEDIITTDEAKEKAKSNSFINAREWKRNVLEEKY